MDARQLFRNTMIATGLDRTYGAYVELLPGRTLATVNLISLFGLHRRCRGALIGHLAAFEMTSTLPNRAYGYAFRRLGSDAETTRFFEEHVEADSIHEVLASDLAIGVASRSPPSRPTSSSGRRRWTCSRVASPRTCCARGAGASDAPQDRHVAVTGCLSYVLPLRTRAGDLETDELTRYLEWLSARTVLIVVDGSEPMPFQTHRERWGSFATHVPPDDDIRSANGKVRGVLTGLRLAEHERVVLADDDVRYDARSLERMSRLLWDADLVRPQNYFDPLPGTRGGIRPGSS